MVQGVGAAMIITNAAAILTDATPRNELGKILGMNSVAFRLGSIMGLTLSGVILWITDWRALFYINIPIGIFGTVWAHYRLKETSTRDSYRGMDWVGFVSFSAGLGLLLLALTYLSFGLTGYFPGFAMLATGISLLLFFIWYEFHGKMATHPLLDMNLFKIKEFAGGTNRDDVQRDCLVRNSRHGFVLPAGDRGVHPSRRVPACSLWNPLSSLLPPRRGGCQTDMDLGRSAIDRVDHQQRCLLPLRFHKCNHGYLDCAARPRPPGGRHRTLGLSQYRLDHGLRSGEQAGNRFRFRIIAFQCGRHDEFGLAVLLMTLVIPCNV